MTVAIVKPITPESFLTKPEIETLIAVRRDSRRMFDVGDITQNALRRSAKLEIHKFMVLNAVGDLCGLGGRRVEKLRRVAEIFSKEQREPFLSAEFPFTYFETAFDFHNEEGEAVMFLEFTQHWLEENGKWPGVDYAATMFRTHALGLDVSPIKDGEQNPAPARPGPNRDVPEPPAPPDGVFPGLDGPWMHTGDPMVIAAERVAVVEKQKLVRLLDMWRSCANMTVQDCIADLEALL